MRPGIRIIAAGFVILGLVLLEGCDVEEKFIFFPVAEISKTPRNYGLSFEDVYFKTEDGVTLNGWFVAYPGASTTLFWFHGNGGNIGHRSCKPTGPGLAFLTIAAACLLDPHKPSFDR